MRDDKTAEAVADHLQAAWDSYPFGLPPIVFTPAEAEHLANALRAQPQEAVPAEMVEENRRLRLIVEVVANADSEDAIGSLDVDIPKGGYPRQWLRNAARAALSTPSTEAREGGE